MGEQITTGILVVDKEAGWTSHDVVRKLRRILEIKKIGHTGTLDPLATGVLVMLLGRATRILRFLQEQEKEYIGEICLGVSTDTFDAQGRVRERKEVPELKLADVEKACKSFEREMEQSPPVFSAIKVGGKKSYQLARAGTPVQLKPRHVNILQVELLKWKSPVLKLRVLCSRGTYIRSLAEDIGQQLGCGGHLLSLRRIRSGEFSIDRALTLSQIFALREQGKLEREVIPIDHVLRHLPAISLSRDEVFGFKHGAGVASPVGLGASLGAGSQCRYQGGIRVKDEAGCLVGIGRLDPTTEEVCPVSVLT